MHHWEHGIAGAWGSAMVSGKYAFWAVAAVAIIWAVRTTRRSTAKDARTHQPAAAAAEQVLAGRMARREIDPHEYRTTPAVLRPGRSS